MTGFVVQGHIYIMHTQILFIFIQKKIYREREWEIFNKKIDIFYLFNTI